MAPPKVRTDRHDDGGAKVVVTGPRLNAAIEAWSVIKAVVEVVVANSQNRAQNER
jgi:hypothetical protein